MNGVHDMGGMDGFGPVVREQNEPVFHADWERRMYALVGPVMGSAQVNIDEFRHAIERIPARAVPRVELLRTMGRGGRDDPRRARRRNTRGTARKAGCLDRPASDRECGRRSWPGSRQRQTRIQNCARPLCQRRSRTRTQLESFGTHAPAALCSRQNRGHRTRLGSVRLSRHQRASCMHQAATLLLGLI